MGEKKKGEKKGEKAVRHTVPLLLIENFSCEDCPSSENAKEQKKGERGERDGARGSADPNPAIREGEKKKGLKKKGGRFFLLFFSGFLRLKGENQKPLLSSPSHHPGGKRGGGEKKRGKGIELFGEDCQAASPCRGPEERGGRGGE